MADPSVQQTLCEINGRIVNAPAGAALDVDALAGASADAWWLCQVPDLDLHPDAAANAGGLGRAVLTQQQQRDTRQAAALRGEEDGDDDAAHGRGQPESRVQQQLRLLSAMLRMSPPRPAPAAVPRGRPMEWHGQLPWLAVADQAGRVLVFRLETGDAGGGGRGGGGAAAGRGGGSPAMLSEPEMVVQHELQAGVRCLAWRPRSGGGLAVGCERGVCLWSLRKGPSGTTAARKAPGLDGGSWMTLLRSRMDAPVVAMAWSPCGMLLAAACGGVPGITVWDVASAQRVPLQSALEEVTLLRWSPCGAYLFGGSSMGGGFRVWETSTWTSVPWSNLQGSGLLADAAWSPDGTCVAVGYAHSSQLAVLYFTGGKASREHAGWSLEAQLLPLPLQELAPPEGQQVPTTHGLLIRSLAWDPSGQRLAVALGGAHPSAQGQVAVYATSVRPVLSLRFLGFVLPPAGAAKAAAIAFAPRQGAGALLAVRGSVGPGAGERVHMVPMLYR